MHSRAGKRTNEIRNIKKTHRSLNKKCRTRKLARENCSDGSTNFYWIGTHSICTNIPIISSGYRCDQLRVKKPNHYRGRLFSQISDQFDAAYAVTLRTHLRGILPIGNSIDGDIEKRSFVRGVWKLFTRLFFCSIFFNSTRDEQRKVFLKTCLLIVISN